MVQFIRGLQDPSGKLSEMLGGAISQGISKNLPQPEMLVQRKMLSEAFENAKKTGQDPNASPLDLAFSFLQATAGIPGAERYVGQVLPLVMKQAAGKQAAGLEPPSGANLQQPEGMQPAAGVSTKIQPNQEAAPVQDQQITQDSRQIDLPPPMQDQSDLYGSALEPTSVGSGPLPKVYSPEELRQIEQADLERGWTDLPSVQRAEAHNERERQKVDDYLKGAGAQSKIAESRREGQQQFRNFLSAHLNTDSPLKLALAENIAEQDQYRNIANDNIRAERVSQAVRPLENLIDKFDNNSYRPNPWNPLSSEQYQKSFRNLQQDAKPLLKYGMRDYLENFMAQKGWTKTETNQVMNPLGNEVISKFNKLPDLPQSADIFYEAGELLTGKRRLGNEETQNLEKANKQWSGLLEKTIKPQKVNPKNQEVIRPGTNLFLLGNEYMKKGGNWMQFNDIVRDLVDGGKIKLDETQAGQLQDLSQRPSSYLSIGEFLFGTKSL